MGGDEDISRDDLHIDVHPELGVSGRLTSYVDSNGDLTHLHD
jgi:hypothetical protein